MPHDLLRVYITEQHGLAVEVSAWALVIGGLLTIFFLVLHFRHARKPYQVIQLNIQLGNIGLVQLKPNWEDIQVAHRIWTELVTRKAAIPIDPNQDRKSVV
jgi:hypothetical protein